VRYSYSYMQTSTSAEAEPAIPWISQHEGEKTKVQFLGARPVFTRLVLGIMGWVLCCVVLCLRCRSGWINDRCPAYLYACAFLVLCSCGGAPRAARRMLLSFSTDSSCCCCCYGAVGRCIIIFPLSRDFGHAKTSNNPCTLASRLYSHRRWPIDLGLHHN
jgi:hypothetical protein